MLLKNIKGIKNINYKYCIYVALALIIFGGFLLYIVNCTNLESENNQDIFAYSVKVRDSFEQLDQVFERAELSVNLMVDAIANSYDTNKQKNKSYNLSFIKNFNGLIKSVLSNSPSIDGAWFQLNADLPYSEIAYNWFEFKESQFINGKYQFKGSSINRKITPEDDQYYFGALSSKNVCWSDIYTDPDTKKEMMTVSSPIYKNGMLVGVVGIDITVDSLQQRLKNMQLILGKSELYLLDKKNNIILYQTFSNSNSFKDNYSAEDAFKKTHEGPVVYYDHLTQKTAIKLTLSNDYKVVISIENKILYCGGNHIIKIIYVLFILLILVTILAFINYFKLKKKSQVSEFLNAVNNIDSVQKDEK